MLGLGLFFTAHTALAQGKPDLVITTDSRIPLKGSCEKGKPLWEGIIAIKNIGDADAVFGGGGGLTDGGILDAARSGNSILSVYVPQNIDIKEEKALNRPLRPLDQLGFSISIGENRFKKCRLFQRPPTIRDQAGNFLNTYVFGRPSRTLVRSRSATVEAVQRALIAKGYNLPNFGADGDYGGETEAAVRRFYADNGGDLPADVGSRPPSRATLSELIDRLDGAVSDVRTCVAGARGRKETVIVYAIVDPGDEIAEINEANNSAEFKVEIDCTNVTN